MERRVYYTSRERRDRIAEATLELDHAEEFLAYIKESLAGFALERVRAAREYIRNTKGYKHGGRRYEIGDKIILHEYPYTILGYDIGAGTGIETVTLRSTYKTGESNGDGIRTREDTLPIRMVFQSELQNNDPIVEDAVTGFASNALPLAAVAAVFLTMAPDTRFSHSQYTYEGPTHELSTYAPQEYTILQRERERAHLSPAMLQVFIPRDADARSITEMTTHSYLPNNSDTVEPTHEDVLLAEAIASAED